MAKTSSTRSIKSNEFGYAQARHLLNRGGFGGTPVQIKALQQMGIAQAVDFVVDYQLISDESLANPEYDANLIRPYSVTERAQMRRARQDQDEEALQRIQKMFAQRRRGDRAQLTSLRQWWVQRMIETPRPLEEKLVLLWHGHFASNHRTVRDSYLMFKQNEMFRGHANQSFARLAMEIVRDPAMIRFLNNNSNNRRKPNENLARELMELFTLGEGHYTEQDIKEGARALTGYSYRDNWFVFNPGAHDPGVKTILGQQGNFDGDDFVRILLNEKQCAMFITHKLYKYFVNDLPAGDDAAARKFIRLLANQLYNFKYQLVPVLKTLLRSRHFYDPANMGNMVKSPAQLVVGTVRMLQTSNRDVRILDNAMDRMSQRLFDPPSVAGWAAGRSWINTSTLFVRQNLAAYLLTGRVPFGRGSRKVDASYDPMFLIRDLPEQTPQAVVDHLISTLLGEQAMPQHREHLIGYVNDRGNTINRDTMIGLLLLITAMPEYQLC